MLYALIKYVNINIPNTSPKTSPNKNLKFNKISNVDLLLKDK